MSHSKWLNVKVKTILMYNSFLKFFIKNTILIFGVFLASEVKSATSINIDGGEVAYIRENLTNLEYSSDYSNWVQLSTPLNVNNTNPSSGLVLSFVSGTYQIQSNDYIVLGSDGISFDFQTIALPIQNAFAVNSITNHVDLDYSNLSISTAFLLNHGSVTSFDNNASIINWGEVIANDGNTLATINSVNNTGIIRSLNSYVIDNGSGAQIDNLTNSITGEISSDSSYAIINSGTITNLENSGVILSSTTTINNNGGSIGTFTNTSSGEIRTTGVNPGEIAIFNSGNISSLINDGVISSIDTTVYNAGSGVIESLTNTGNISSQNSVGINNDGSIDTLTNNALGAIEGGILNGGTIGSIINSGVISGTNGIFNNGTISSIYNGVGGIIEGSIDYGVAGGVDLSLTNYGTISSLGVNGWAVSGNHWNVINYGIINGENSIWAGGSSIVYNYGSLVGNVVLDSGSTLNLLGSNPILEGNVESTGSNIGDVTIGNGSSPTAFSSSGNFGSNYALNNFIVSDLATFDLSSPDSLNSSTFTVDGIANIYGSLNAHTSVNFGGYLEIKAGGVINSSSLTLAGSLVNSGTLSSQIDVPSLATADISNSGEITGPSAINNLGHISLLENTLSGVINGIGGSGYSGIYSAGSIDAIVNRGLINSTDYVGLYVDTNASISSIQNRGTISGNLVGVTSNGAITLLENYENISGVVGQAIELGNGSTIATLNNYGNIYGPNSIVNSGYIGEITNSGAGSIYCLSSCDGAIYNHYGTIQTLNNFQGAGSAHGELTLYGNLPSNYNIIVNDTAHYGKLSVTNASGSTTFAISPLSATHIGAAGSRYQNVISGVGANLIANENVTLNYQSGNLTATYQLVADDSNVADTWDLLILSMINGPSTTDTQASIHSLASKLRSGFSSQVIATNFANMNTYDCNLFDARGMCISVGGQQTYVDNPSSNLTSTVVVVGYKVSPTLRIGGFLNQNLNNSTSRSVDISNANPLMGLFAVWNQNEDQLGYQVKVANAYQDKDVSTMRDVIGTSEAGRGSTELNTQSYVGELSYAFLANEDKTLVRPYAAVRYTRIKQDGYTETGVSTPLTYSALSDRSTAVLGGVKLNHKLAEKVNLTGSLGIEQDIYHHVDDLKATGVSNLTSENFNDNIKRTRPVASIGAYYSLAKNQRIAADIYYQQLPFQSTGGTTAYVNYSIGF